MPVPPGCNVKYGPVEGPALAETSLSGGCTITIDLDALTAYVRKFGDGFGGNPADMPLVLAVVLMHELFHHPFYGAWSDSTCHEIALAQMVADALSSLIDLVASEGGDVANLCAMLEAMRNNFNEGSGDGSACEQGAELGCTEPCEPIETNSNCGGDE